MADVGRHGGDALLKQVAARMMQDSRARTQLARVGADHFAVLLPDTSPEAVGVIAEKLRSKIALLIVKYAPHALRVTASFGVASLQQGDAGMTDLLEKSDAALYRAKNAGRNKVRIFDHVQDRPARLALTKPA